MKRTLFSTVLLLAAIATKAQTADSTAFTGHLYSDENDVFMHIDFYHRNVNVSGQEMLGPLPGYIGREKTSYCWLILEAEVKESTALLQIVNDSGSEDLTATLIQMNDSVYELRQKSGSTIKLPKKGKWQKLPHTVKLKRKNVK